MPGAEIGEGEDQAIPGSAATSPTPISSRASRPRDSEMAPGPAADGVLVTPWAVMSKTQERTTATGKPTASATSTTVSTQSPRCAPCMIGSMTWRTANAKIP
jgi:hypothetical protein